MIFNDTNTSQILYFYCGIIIISACLHFVLGKKKAALGLLLIGGASLRFFFASFEPFIQDWDERFHALVAKNMMDYPFRPMLRAEPIMPYNMNDWCCNHIWLHKQPLFMWQMAISMKILGVSTLAVRFPSIIMGMLSIYFIYEIAKYWTKNLDVAFVSSLLFAFSFYQLELTAGRLTLEQNDVAFAFYVTGSIWAFVRYLHASRKTKWLIGVGVFVGGAVLCKWLTGILVFGGWGLYILLTRAYRTDIKKWRDIALSALVACLVFVPWQLYIMNTFPAESALSYEHNRRHITEAVEGHAGDDYFHLEKLDLIYGEYMWYLALVGLLFMFLNKRMNWRLSTAFVAMVLVVYVFFSLFVKTKMPSFPFLVHSLMWISIALGAVSVLSIFRKIKPIIKNIIGVLLIGSLAVYVLRIDEVAEYRKRDNWFRTHKFHNASIYKNLNVASDSLKDRVILNCKGLEDIELMFYQDVNAYTYFPDERTLDSLIQDGHQFAAFPSFKDQILPDYILKNKEILILEGKKFK